MPTLIACLSSGKGTWSEVSKLIAAQDWNKVFLITNEFGKQNFSPQKNTQLVLIDIFREVPDIVIQIKQQLKGKVDDFEAALNLSSGTGKEHLAVLEAVLELGLNFRLVTIVNGKIEILGMTQED